MIISHEHRFIFIKTHKTAGTSIELFLSKLAGEDAVVPPAAAGSSDEPQLDARNWKALFNPLPEMQRACRSGAPINGPFPRLLGGGTDPPNRRLFASLARSAYQCARRLRFFDHMSASVLIDRVGRGVWNDYFTFCFERNPWDKAVSQYSWRAPADSSDFSAWVLNNQGHLESDWPLYSIGDQIAVDFVGRYENMEEDLAFVLGRVGVNVPDGLTVPRAHVGRRRAPGVISRDASARIGWIFRNEIAHFGYREPEEDTFSSQRSS
jgi:hypothetical protein